MISGYVAEEGKHMKLELVAAASGGSLLTSKFEIFINVL